MPNEPNEHFKIAPWDEVRQEENWPSIKERLGELTEDNQLIYELYARRRVFLGLPVRVGHDPIDYLLWITSGEKGSLSEFNSRKQGNEPPSTRWRSKD